MEPYLEKPLVPITGSRREGQRALLPTRALWQAPRGVPMTSVRQRRGRRPPRLDAPPTKWARLVSTASSGTPRGRHVDHRPALRTRSRQCLAASMFNGHGRWAWWFFADCAAHALSESEGGWLYPRRYAHGRSLSSSCTPPRSKLAFGSTDLPASHAITPQRLEDPSFRGEAPNLRLYAVADQAAIAVCDRAQSPVGGGWGHPPEPNRPTECGCRCQLPPATVATTGAMTVPSTDLQQAVQD